MFFRQVARFFSSALKPRSNFKVEVESLTKALSNRGEEIEWQSIRDDVINSNRRFNAANLDGNILGVCHQERRLDVAKSYVNFLRCQSLHINEATASLLLRLFHTHYEQGENEVSPEDEAEIIKLSRSLIEKHEILEATLAENIIHGLSITREWLECVELLEKVKELYTPSKSTYSCIISKALKEDNLVIAWKLLDELFANQTKPATSTLLQYFIKFQADDKKTEQMLKAVSENNLMLPDASINHFKDIFKNSTIVRIDDSGNCPSCRNILPSAKLNETEFKHLSDTFLNKVFLRKDVFLQTNPEELRRFKNFVEKSLPYDCVIDGLNVAYSHGTKSNATAMAHNVSFY